MTTQTMCNHFFCTMPARAYSRRVASYKVTQTFPNGRERVTFVCEDDMHAMQGVLTPSDTVTKL
jgi:hypothetical protein